MNIQWYPGHMAKSIRELSERIAKVDAAVELVDARIPVSGRNPVLAELLKNKPHIVILTKADLADAEQTKRWISTFREQGIYAFSCNSKSGEGCNRLHSEIQTVLREKIERRNARGLGALAIKLMVVGIPNVGKSSFINRLSGKKAARAEDRPGVTRTSTWIRLRDGIDLLDTPGLLWPKLDPPQAGMHLAVTGAVRDEILDTTELAAELAGELVTIVPETMAEKCGTDVLAEKTGLQVLELFAKKRGFLLRGGAIDVERGAKILLDEYRGGKFGRITLEPTDFTYRVIEPQFSEEPDYDEE